MTPRRILIVLAALAVGGAVVLLWPSEPITPEEEVRRRILQLVHAAEEKDLGEVMDGVSDTFRSDAGWNKAELKRVLAAQVLRGQYVRILPDLRHLTAVNPQEVEVEARFYFARADVARVEELARDSVVSAWLIEATFQKEGDGTWRVVRARHRPLGASELF